MRHGGDNFAIHCSNMRQTPHHSTLSFILRFSQIFIMVGALSAQLIPEPAQPEFSTLGNGLEVMAVSLPGTDVSTISLIFNSGSDAEAPDQKGWFHLLERMLWMGHDGYPRQTDFLRHSYAVGVTGHSETTPGSMRITLSAPTDSLQSALILLLEIIRTPNIDQAQLDIEKRVILQELDHRAAAPIDQLWSAYDALVTPSDGAAASSRDILFDATVEKIRLLKLRHLLANNAGLIVASNHSTQAIIDMVRLTMGRWPSGFLNDVSAVTFSEQTTIRSRDRVIVQEVRYPRFVIGWDAPPAADIAGTRTAKLLVELLRGADSPFYLSLMDRGIVLALDATYRARPGGGSIVLQFTLPRRRPAMAQGFILQEIRKLADPTYLGPNEIRRAKSRLRITMNAMQGAPALWTDHFGDSWASSGLRARAAGAMPPSDVTQSNLFELLQHSITGVVPYTVLMLDQEGRDDLPGNQTVNQ